MSRPGKVSGKSLWQILRVPSLVFLVIAGGLAAALLGDGWWHVLSWVMMIVPLAILVKALTRQPQAE